LRRGRRQMPSPSVSVVLPVRDGERFVREAIDSVLAQTLGDFELIVVDDGSADGTWLVLDGLSDPRVRVLRRPREGLVPALRAGVAETQAEYVARMDADDVSEPERLQREVELLERRPRVGMVATWTTVIDEDGQELRRVVLPSEHVDLARRLLLRNPFQHGAVLLRRAALEDAGGYRPDYGANEDYDLWRRLARSWELACIPEALYRYRVHSAAVTRTDPCRELERERLRDELWRDYNARSYEVRPTVARARGAEPDVRRGLEADQRALAREALRRGRAGLAVKALTASLLLSRR
jgi:glycosyltransferase involved in cell wall biosynthesis